MTDEPREENRPEDEEVEGHLPPAPIPVGDTHRGEDDDGEGHSASIGTPSDAPIA